MEEWLDSIKRAKATRAKIRNLMSVLFHHAMRYEWVDRNPVKLVRQSAKRERVPDVLELSELQLLLSRLELRERTLALRWEDVDFKALELRVTRSIWHQVIGECKTEASAKPVPLDEYMAEDLLRWRRSSPYPLMSDWVFASPHMRGVQPYWPDNLMKRYIRPTAQKAGIHKNIGWHTFRHTFATLAQKKGTVKDVQGILRHARPGTTTDVYMQEIPESVRATVNSIHTELRSGESKSRQASEGARTEGSKPAKRNLNPGLAVTMTTTATEPTLASEGKGPRSSQGKVLEFATRMRQSSGKEVVLNA